MDVRTCSENQSINSNNLIASFNKWKIEFEKIALEKEKLQKEHEFNELQMQMAKENKNTHQHETTHLRTSVDTLHKTVQRLLHFEVENVELVDKMRRKEETIKEIKQERERKIQILEEEMLEMRILHQSEISDLRKKLEMEEKAKIEVYKKIIDEKESEIANQKEQMEALQRRHSEELMKSKLECDHKLMKLQEQTKFVKSGSKLTSTCANSSAGMEILRKKMQNMQNQHAIEITNLQAKLKDLQEKTIVREQFSAFENREQIQTPTRHLTLKRKKK